MTDTFEYVNEYAEHVVQNNDQRVAEQNKYLDDYLMRWGEEAAVKNQMEGIKIIKSPDVRNRIQGASRLLASTSPQFSVPEEMNEDIDEDIRDKMEKIADRMFRAAGRVSSNPIEYDVALSLNLFAEVHIGITRTSDLISQANKKDQNELNEAAIYRAEEIARITPYMYDVWDPRTGYPDFDGLGLKSYYREVETTVGNVMDEFGKDADRFFKEPINPYGQTTLCQLWNWMYRYVWIKGQNEFLYTEKHGLPFIPIVAEIGEGSLLFENPEDQRQPMGYTVVKSGLGNIQNLSLTLAYSSLMKTGSNPQWTSVQGTDGKYAMPDFSVMAGVWRVPRGGSVSPVDLRNSVNPQILDMLQLADQKVQASTIYSQTLGEPLGGNSTYSETALLHQAGRLPLLLPQKKGGRAIAELVKKSLVWMKKEKPQGYSYSHILGDMKMADIPDHFEMDCKLEISLPQDDLQNANVAARLREGDNPLVSDDWIREMILNMKQPGEMRNQIWDEMAANLDARAYFADQVLRVKQLEEQAMTPTPQQDPMQGQPMQPPQGPPMPPPPEQAGVMQGGVPSVMQEGGMGGPLPVPGGPPEDGVL